MGVHPTSIAELHFPEVIIDIALFSIRTSSFFFCTYLRFVKGVFLLLFLLLSR